MRRGLELWMNAEPDEPRGVVYWITDHRDSHTPPYPPRGALWAVEVLAVDGELPAPAAVGEALCAGYEVVIGERA